MKIETHAELKKLLALCREANVLEMTIDGINFKLKEIDTPVVNVDNSGPEAKSSAEYSDEEILNWSAQAVIGG